MHSVINVKKFGSYVIIFFLFFFAYAPAFVFSAESDATKAGKTGITYECGNGITAGNCDFNDLINGTKKIVNFGMTLALSFSVVVIAWAGFNYMISGDNPKKRTEANKSLQKVAIGIILILSAWLIVTLITGKLLTDSVKGVVPIGN